MGVPVGRERNGAEADTRFFGRRNLEMRYGKRGMGSKSAGACVWARESECTCMCVCVRVCVKGREGERERERERKGLIERT